MVKNNMGFLRGIKPRVLPKLCRRLTWKITSAMDSLRAEAQDAQDEAEEGREEPLEMSFDDDDVQTVEKRVAEMDALGAALLLVLHAQGWQLHAKPGELYLERDGLRIEPFPVVRGLGDGSEDAAAWLELCQQAGIADLDLGAIQV